MSKYRVQKWTPIPGNLVPCDKFSEQELREINAELLDALRLIVASDGVTSAIDPRYMDKARAALAKAEGANETIP